MNFRIGEYGKYESFIRDTERRYSLPVNVLAVTLFQASKYDPDHIAGKGRRSVGPRAALGIANLTQADCEILWNGQDKRLDPLASIVGAARMLRAQYNRFGNWRHAIVAYHSSADILKKTLRQQEPMPINAARYAQEIAALCRI